MTLDCHRPRHAVPAGLLKAGLRYGLFGLPLGLSLGLSLLGSPAWAACVTAGATTTCDTTAPNPVTSTVGEGNTAAGDNRTVVVGTGAGIAVGDTNAISLRDNANITVQGRVSAVGVAAEGGYDTGANTIEFRNNGTLVVEQGGEVVATGTQVRGEPVNIQGFGSTVINRGLIEASNAAAIWLQEDYSLNTVINDVTGVIRSPGNIDWPASVLGGSGFASVDFTNRGLIDGGLHLLFGDDILRIYTGSVITGAFSGGPGNDTVYLSGTGTDAMAGTFTGFEALIKNDTGTWTLTGPVTNMALMQVQAGTLILTGDNAGFTGLVQVDAAGTLQGRAQSLPLAITDNGLVRFAQPDAGTYAGLISGTGWVEKTGDGVLVLAPAAPGGNTYGGGTLLSGGVLAIAADGAIGAPTAQLVFNGGTLRFDAAFDPAATRPISILAPGGTIDTNGFAPVIAQGITGAGGLTVAGAGSLTLTGSNVYAGGTTIDAGATLRLGAGGGSGSIAGNVLDNGLLVFNRADTVGFGGVVSGTGALRQAGPGTLVLTAANTYSGGTTIDAGARLQLGAGGTSGSILGDVANQGTLAFDRSDTVTFGGTISGSGGVEQNGTGTTVLGGPNTYAGATRVNAGTLRAGAAGVFSAASVHEVGAAGVLDLAGRDQTIGGLANAGLVTLGGAPGTVLTVAGNIVGQGGVVALNTYLGADGSPTDRLRLRGGTASGDTVLRITNVGGPGAQTLSDGIRVVEVTDGGTTAADAFRLSGRVAAGAFDYRLFRGGSTGAEDWFLRSYRIDTTDGGATSRTPLYRPEVALYAPIPDMARQMGLATLGTLHARVGEEENIRGIPSGGDFVNGAWARAFGEQRTTRWHGGATPEADGSIGGFQAGLDLFRREGADGHRDHAGFYAAYTQYNADVSGFARGQDGLAAGRLTLEGPALGAYWTHFGPGGWYLDAVFQANWFDARARSDYGERLSTNGTGLAASLEGGYPIAFATNWTVEPQAQLVWQSVSVDGARDSVSTVDWREGTAVTGRLGGRVQYSARDGGNLWQPYARVNLWQGFSGTDYATFGGSDTIATLYGGTSLEAGLGITARIGRKVSLYAHADYRWGIDGDRSRGTVAQGAAGLRVNW